MSELTAKRWEKGDRRPESHKVTDALEVVLHRIRTGEIKPEHVVIVIGCLDNDGVDFCSFFQAGPYNHYAQIGLLEAAQMLMHDSASP